MGRSTRAGSGVSTTSVTRVARWPTGANWWVCRHGSTADKGTEASASANSCGGSYSPGWWAATQRNPPGSRSTACPSRTEPASRSTRTGGQGGISRVMAPGLACQANTSSSGASTTLEYFSPMIAALPGAPSRASLGNNTKLH